MASIWPSMFKVAAATAAFGLVHSLLASRASKNVASRILGERNRDGLYRVAYIGQSLVSFALLAAYIRRQPSRELYRINGATAIAMHGVQVGAFVYAILAARQVGMLRITGLKSLHSWLGDSAVMREPEAQGPALDDADRRESLGPFAYSRHPLNFAPLPILWLWPRMTTSLFAFNTVASVYLFVGSLHEEARLRQALGDVYSRYQKCGIPFYAPSISGRMHGRQLTVS